MHSWQPGYEYKFRPTYYFSLEKAPQVITYLFLSLGEQSQKTSYDLAPRVCAAVDPSFPSHFYETPSRGCRNFCQVNEAKRSRADPLIWRWDVVGCPRGAGVRLKARIWGMHLKCLCISLHSLLPACSTDLQARPKSSQANEVNNDWRLAKRCWLPIGCLSPAGHTQLQPISIICIHIAATPKAFKAALGHYGVFNMIKFCNKTKGKWNQSCSFKGGTV